MIGLDRPPGSSSGHLGPVAAPRASWPTSCASPAPPSRPRWHRSARRSPRPRFKEPKYFEAESLPKVQKCEDFMTSRRVLKAPQPQHLPRPWLRIRPGACGLCKWSTPPQTLLRVDVKATLKQLEHVLRPCFNRVSKLSRPRPPHDSCARPGAMMCSQRRHDGRAWHSLRRNFNEFHQVS